MNLHRPNEEGFKPPTCACGHPSGDHKSGGGRSGRFGFCFRCDCTEFVEVKRDEVAAVSSEGST